MTISETYFWCPNCDLADDSSLLVRDQAGVQCCPTCGCKEWIEESDPVGAADAMS